MKLFRRRVLHLAAGAAALTSVCLSLAGHGASAQTQRTIKLVVPSAPGGATDILARLLGEQIGRTQGATVVIDNRPGAGQGHGTGNAARAPARGTPRLLAANPFLINPLPSKAHFAPPA